MIPSDENTVTGSPSDSKRTRSTVVNWVIVYLPPLQEIFATQALSQLELGVVLAASTIVFVAAEAEKWIVRRRAARARGAGAEADPAGPLGSRSSS